MNETTRVCPKCGATIPPEAPQGLCPKCVLGGAAEAPATATASGLKWEPPPLERIAAAFPQLEVAELIGAGGMGAVFKGRQPKLERWVALKVLPEAMAADPSFAERFSREARLLARLNHPNIVTVYDFGQAGGFFFLLMEYVDGVNLREAMAAGRFTPAQALSLVPKICEALQYAHDEGVLHRDIKPENILLDVKGRVKIADFGIAKLLGERKEAALTAQGAAVGTPHYMAPEQLDHPQEVDQRADIYSLGVVFYEMLTGELPIGHFAPPSEKSPVDPRVDPIVLRALERDREKRFRSASEVKTRVENLGPLPPPAIGTLTPPAPKAVQWCRKAVAAASLTAVSLALGVPLALITVFLLYAMASRSGGVGVGEIVVLGGLGLLTVGAALAAFILGIMARREIRDSGGSLRGKGLAALAIWTWPVLGVLCGLLVVLAVPIFFISPVSVADRVTVQAESPPMAAAVAEVRRTIQVNFDLPAGQAAVFVPEQVQGDETVPLPRLGAYAVAPSSAPLNGTIVWRQTVTPDADPGRANWSTTVTLGRGGSSMSGGLDAPAEFAALASPEPVHLKIAADSQSTTGLQTPAGEPAGVAILVRSVKHRIRMGGAMPLGYAGTGTNWMTRGHF